MQSDQTPSSAIKTLGSVLLKEIEEALSSPHVSLASEAQSRAIRALTDVGASTQHLLGACEILYGAYSATARTQADAQPFRDELEELARCLAAGDGTDAGLRLRIRDLARALIRGPVLKPSAVERHASAETRGSSTLLRATACTVNDIAGVDITCDRGEILALLGENGTGKSSILRLLAGHSSYARSRELEVAPEVSRRLVEDRISRPSSQVWGTLLATAKIAAPRGTTTKMLRVDVQSLLNRLGLPESDARRPWNTLSDGQAKRFALAQAICTGADIILVDEPMANLDARAEVQQRHALVSYAAQGKSVILSAQRNSVTAGWVTRTYTLERSRLASSKRWECEVAGGDQQKFFHCIKQLSAQHSLKANLPSPAEQGVIYLSRRQAAHTPDSALVLPSTSSSSGYRWILNLPTEVGPTELFSALATTCPYLFSILSEHVDV